MTREVWTARRSLPTGETLAQTISRVPSNTRALSAQSAVVLVNICFYNLWQRVRTEMTAVRSEAATILSTAPLL